MQSPTHQSRTITWIAALLPLMAASIVFYVEGGEAAAFVVVFAISSLVAIVLLAGRDVVAALSRSIEQRIDPWPWQVRRYQQLRRARGSRCIFCGYDLRASPEQCPECGQWAISSDELLARWRFGIGLPHYAASESSGPAKPQPPPLTIRLNEAHQAEKGNSSGSQR